MKILHLLASPVFSGPAESMALLALEQRALGHEVTVAIDRKREGAPFEEPLAPRLAALGLLDDGGLELSVKSTPWAVWTDLRLLHKRRLDVLHAHFSHDHYVARLARPRGAVMIRSVHAPRSIRRTLPAADAFTAPCESELARLAPRRAIVLPPLVAAAFAPVPDRAALRAELALDGAPLLGMASTFQPSRRHGIALEAFAQVRRERPAARLVLMGDGVLEPKLRADVARLGLADAVVFAGYQSGERFVRHLQALDELWVLGLGNDWSGRVAAQARACAVRVLAVDEGGLNALADVLVKIPSPSHVAAASLSAPPRDAEPWRPNNPDIARRVLALYGEAAGA